MRVRVLYFAAARERAGTSEEWLDWEGDLTVEELWREVVQKHPSLGSLTSCMSFAVNREYAPKTQLLRDGDEVAFIPPVSGGSSTEERAV